MVKAKTIYNAYFKSGKLILEKVNNNNYYVSCVLEDQTSFESDLMTLEEAEQHAKQLQKKYKDKIIILEIYRDQPSEEQNRAFRTLIKEVI